MLPPATIVNSAHSHPVFASTVLPRLLTTELEPRSGHSAGLFLFVSGQPVLTFDSELAVRRSVPRENLANEDVAIEPLLFGSLLLASSHRGENLRGFSGVELNTTSSEVKSNEESINMGVPKPLTEAQRQAALKSLPGWSGEETGLNRTLVFEDFPGAMRFMQACIQGIEERNHHPVWTNKFNSVSIHLDTFDIGGKVTQLDVELAQYFDSLLAERGGEFGYVNE